MRDPKDIMEEFVEKNQGPHAFSYNDGSRVQGDILSVEGDYLLMYDTDHPHPAPPYSISISEIDVSTLSYWDDERHEWVDFQPEGES